MIIKILGTGCPKCKKLEASALLAIEQAGLEATVEKVTDLNKIMDYGVIMTPALVIGDKVLSSGKVISPEEIKILISKGV
ncbi:MAG: thioredoxin family protein [Candidatus Cloacimonetes bacterium]|jgi:small redox-active disulfide protein 2|nr:thioredoxin family protein [Candidatus Cloacimonadota bacterium]MDY0337943.1 thioredoxin family protein [Candidatus Cloacimonadaceae bacterium]MCK9335021.1 thioredoxin family protein [Candidatus Cloacimonadota bacterium]MDD2543993.1 thioredoxin family protein [Candidatus Cloacimonadota bacterium]MDD2684029.1 thioredoxin family protein [Candidatus Cloacimonadota bacterium]